MKGLCTTVEHDTWFWKNTYICNGCFECQNAVVDAICRVLCIYIFQTNKTLIFM